jgi:ADP-ribose pyrophosphatase
LNVIKENNIIGYEEVYIKPRYDKRSNHMEIQNSDDKKSMNEYNKAQDTTLAWEEVKTEHIIQDEWIDFRKSAYRLPDGKVFEPFYTYSRKSYVVIVASDTEGRYLCVRQFRQGIRQVTTEFPAGGIERKDGKQYGDSVACEDTLTAAKRELAEETGYESDEWTHLLTVPSNATMADNYAYIFMAKNCRKVTRQSLDETEFLNVNLYSESEIENLITNGNFQQAVHILAWLMSRKA